MSSEKEIYYNIWYLPKNRWTNVNGQNTNKPTLFSYEEASAYARLHFGTIYSSDIEIRQVLEDYSPGPIGPIVKDSSTSNTIKNDWVCPTCKNDRCSKLEKICWKCGNNLNGKN